MKIESDETVHERSVVVEMSTAEVNNAIALAALRDVRPEMKLTYTGVRYIVDRNADGGARVVITHDKLDRAKADEI